MHDTLPYLSQMNFPSIERKELNTVQINIGLKCNQQCVHCHVNSSPKRTEMMSSETIDLIKSFLLKKNVQTLDITGGAPELHPEFKELVTFSRNNNIHVIDRCNLTILSEDGMDDLAQFLARNEVEIVASLPCYEEKNVDAQRGEGVFARSIAGLRSLNKLGYGKTKSNLVLNLVYNPQGAVLPPAQDELELAYKKELLNKYNIEFNQLFTICNMPIKRFGSTLVSQNKLSDYMTLLKNAYNEDNLENIMCRHLISIDWQGNVYDCDFNQMLGLNKQDSEKHIHLSELFNTDVNEDPVAVRDHCYGCTAGQGSSCSGALA